MRRGKVVEKLEQCDQFSPFPIFPKPMYGPVSGYDNQAIRISAKFVLGPAAVALARAALATFHFFRCDRFTASRFMPAEIFSPIISTAARNGSLLKCA